jgi:hypothetical protein
MKSCYSSEELDLASFTDCCTTADIVITFTNFIFSITVKTIGLQVHIPLGAWIFVRGFLRFVELCRTMGRPPPTISYNQ